MKAFESNAH